METHTKKTKQATEKDYIIAILILTSIVLAYFIYVNFIPKISFEKKIGIEIIEITADCDECFDISMISESVLKENVKLKSKKTFDYNSEEARELIEKYSIQSVPAVIVISGKIDKIGISEEIFSISERHAIFDKSVPYIDINSGGVKGIVSLKEIQASNCKNCFSLSKIKAQLEAMGVKIENYEIVLDSSANGKQLIKENSLSFAPALLISKNIEEYWWVFSQIKGSFIEQQDYYILKTAIPPYKEISTGQIKGMVDITYIENKTCSECFNVTQLKSSFQGLGVYINNEKHVDVSSEEGRALLSRYKIKAIPTIILSKEIEDYEALKKTLEQVGTFEQDRNFVFRELDALNVKYQSLE